MSEQEKTRIEKARKQREVELKQRRSKTFITVPEGAAVGIMRFGEFDRFVMSWRGRKFDKEWNVITGKPSKLRIGGLRLKLAGFETVYSYPSRWNDSRLTSTGEEIVQFHEEILDYILVKEVTLFLITRDIETSPTAAVPERIPITITWNVTKRVVNPYKALFVAPPNWNEKMDTRLKALFRSWGSKKPQDEIIQLKGSVADLWDEFKDEPLLKMFKDDWGIEIVQNGIEIKDVIPPEEIAKAAQAEKKAELDTKAERRKLTINAGTRILVERSERDAEQIELRHVAKMTKELQEKAGLSPKDAVEVVQTERGKVTKQIIEYRGLEGAGGLPLISIGGERAPTRDSQRPHGGDEKEKPREEKDTSTAPKSKTLSEEMAKIRRKYEKEP